ncbi:hypothetical protein Tco_1388437 [Tanacetum coccineum]
MDDSVFGFAAALAVLITGASQSKQHDMSEPARRGNGYSQKDKNEAKTGQNRARDWKEHGKPKPKAYAS